MVPILSNKYLKIVGQFYIISLSRGMGPYIAPLYILKVGYIHLRNFSDKQALNVNLFDMITQLCDHINKDLLTVIGEKIMS